MFEQIISLVAIHRCISCSTEGCLLCGPCSKQLPGPHTVTFSGAALLDVRAATTYEGASKDLVHKVKFERARAGAADIARIIAARVAIGDALIVPVPTATSRIRSRGYDQASLIARSLSRVTGNPSLPLLGRLGQQRQLGQTRTIRRTQLEAAFYVKMPDVATDRDIILVDDVFTTGSTLQAAAEVLKQAGARTIRGVVFAMA